MPSKRSTPRPKPTAKLEIFQYLHCRKCLNEVLEKAPDARGESPATYSRLDVGFTPVGLQVFCRRHNINVVHIDFQGQTHPANLAGED